MPITYVNHPYVDGNVMSWGQLAADFAAARVYSNEITIADIAAASVRREHLVRPFITGFPLNSFESDFQGTFWRSFGMDEPTALTTSDWGARRNRLTWIPFVNDGIRARWYFPIGFSFSIPESRDIEVLCSLEFQNRGQLPPGGPFYPTGGGAGDLGGYFRIHTYERSTGIERIFPAFDQQVYPNETNPGGILHHDRVQLAMADVLTAGAWDVYLVYDRDLAPGDLEQFDLSRCYLTGEVY